ncbi:MAG: response regulator [Spirochaetes bacterium]|nr:response regulator [Spirochaetota bacterium]MBU1082343.1 response regulator [Spirochaetota bacterium]
MPDSVILIVEDEALVGMELKETLERFGYRVPALIKQGEDVPEAIIVHKPDLILMDIRLKGFQDGIETAYMVGGEFEVPFVFLSAYSDDETLARALGTRAYGYLVKPFDEKTLRTTIELALRRSKEFHDRDHNDWYRGILERFPRAVFLTDLYGRISFENAAARAMFKSVNAGKVGTAMHLLVSEPAAMTDLLASAAAIEAAKPAVSRLMTQKSNGEGFLLEVAPIRDETDRPSGFVMLVGAA